MNDDPKPGSFVFGARSGVALAREIGSLHVSDDWPMPLVDRGEVIVAAPSNITVGSYAYARPDDGTIVTEPDGGRNKIIGWWVTTPTADGMAQLHVDLRLDVLSRQ